MDIVPDTMLSGFGKVLEDISAKPNIMLIKHAWNQGYLYGKHEKRFLKDINRRGRLSVKQLHWIRKINRRIRLGIIKRRASDQ